MIASNNTPQTSQSPESLTPTWRPPKAPLPPYRLAKLANALGVSTPVPASHQNSLSRSFSESASPVDPYRRSPTPSTAASASFTTNGSSTSKFLLHVLPPLTFPYDPDNPDDNDLLPPPSAASGYHTQFRRGILVPVHSSFQAQLSAIAKEYALPSAAGLVLYLITNVPSQRPPGPSPTGAIPDDVVEEPGPRISEDTWRHLWARIIHVEQRQDVPPSRSVTPGLIGLRTGLASRSTPHLLDTSPVVTRLPTEPPLPGGTSPSPPSSISDPLSNSKSPADSSADEPGTPDTSAASNVFEPNQRAQSFDLPGLRSPSLIPILAKVEFDIDPWKAVWYEPWLRNRKANHAKRAESRMGRKGSTNDDSSGGQERQPPIQLIIGRQQTASPISIVTPSGGDNAKGEAERVLESGYQQLGADDDDSDSDEDEFEPDEMTTRVVAVDGSGKDPLADVFGTDADAWADIHASSGDRRSLNPNVVNLALTAADLNMLPDDSLQDPDSVMQPEEEEVRELLEQMSRPNSRPTFSVDVLSSPPSKRSSASTHTTKKHVPPPLVLIPKDSSSDLVVPSEASPMPSSAGSVGLAYLNDGSSPEKSPMEEYAETEIADEYDDRYTRVRTPSESDKRAGTIYDELDLGLDSTEEFDENDPNDRRRSQFLLKAQLDEIERTMAQLSPRMLNADLADDSFTPASLSPMTPNSISLSPKAGLLNADYYPPSPHAPPELEHSPTNASSHPSPVRGPPRTSSVRASASGNQWPAVPFSSIRDSQGPGTSNRTDGQPSPPRLALNGVTTSAPKQFTPTPKSSSNVVSAETEKRKRELEEEYPALANPPSPVAGSAADQSVIPLSPDPFGRYPSASDSTVNSRMSESSLQQWDAVTLGRGSISLEPVAEDDGIVAPASQGRNRSATTSRFSADSVTIIGEEATVTAKPSMRTTLMTVKSIKKLWRKSNNKSNSNAAPTATSGRSSPQVAPMRPERPSQETMDLPDVDHPLPTPPPNFKGYSPQVNPPVSLPPRMSQDSHRQSRTSQDQFNPPRTSQDQMNGPNARVPQNLNVPQSKHGLQVPQTPTSGAFPVPVAPPPQQSNHPQVLMVPPQNQGLGPPTYMGRNGNASPIFAAQMLPGRGGLSLDKFHFDQESPYPVHVTNSPRYSPRPISPPLLPPAQAPLPPSATAPATAPAPAPTPSPVHSLPPPVPEKEKPTARKSILKAFQKASKTPPLPSPTDSRSSLDKGNQNPTTVTGRPRRPSFHSTKSSTTSVNDIPPSPQIPGQFVAGSGPGGKNETSLVPVTPTAAVFGDNGESVRSGVTTSSTDSTISQGHVARSTSPSRSLASSSRSSQETRPSFDVSQFEIVSPKTSTLTYPYHGLDHQ
ncbi:hypothetical protein P691DRAFT_807934 [Macrolepiota fuliginosa MF-IS2]|uniref:Uncharacterized protein n=1 Tax=Macrolepiota fuliginosa MF-IS2 TaxID=1400762 RepID=A0A9P6C7Q4_9AGAR|nr:hypothetical protein P691DRAFT_807934 [Macrolepiota fuliginosa MF-IS2]